MAVVEVDKDQIMELFELKQNVKNTVLAVMDNRLTAAHLATDVFGLLELLDKIEIEVVGEPLVEEVPQPEQPAQQPEAQPQEEQAPPPPQPEQQPEQQQESEPAEQPQPEQAQSEQPQPEQEQPEPQQNQS